MTSETTNKFSLEVRERTVRIVDGHRADYGSEWAATTSVAGKIEPNRTSTFVQDS